MDWRPLPYSTTPVCLYVNSIEVARLCQRVDGSWYACLNRHLHYENPERRMVDCSGLEPGRAGIEVWATRHAKRLRAETSARWEKSKDRA